MNLFPDSSTCGCCEAEFNGQGAILLSPPDEDGKREVLPICNLCWEWINEQGAER
jgi:hypothetical protein